MEGEVVNPANNLIPDLPSTMQILANVYHELSSVKRSIEFMNGDNSDDLLESLLGHVVNCNMRVQRVHEGLWNKFYKPTNI